MGRGSGRGDGRGAAKVMKITPAGKVCVASSLLLFVYFLWRLSNSRLFKVFWIMLESNEGNTMSMSGYHTHKEMVAPRNSLSPLSCSHREWHRADVALTGRLLVCHSCSPPLGAAIDEAGDGLF